jgi:CheY-like chemotaxis protein
MVTDRMFLRAELFHDSRRIVAHTTELSASSAFVRTDERIDLGALVELRLSFPRLLPPLQVAARVVSREPGSGHGYWPGFLLDFTTEHERLSQLLRPREARDATSPYRVLVVEDSATMRDVVQHNAARISSTFEIAITSTDTAERARELIAAATFDLAVIDLYLSGPLSGAGLVRELRARELDLPVIGFSIGGSEARRAFMEAGADLFLDKPVMLRDVFATLECLVRAAEAGQ